MGSTAAVIGALLPVSGHAALSGFALGDAANYGVLFEGNGGNKLNINNGPGLNGLAANGNIGIDLTGFLQLSGPLVVNGNVDFANSVNDNGPYSGNVVVNGTISGGHANVHTDLVNMNGLSSTLGGEMGTSLAIDTSGGSQIVDVSAGKLDGSGNKVFNVSSINFGNSQTLTINGDGAHKVVFNFASAASFGGKILLTGGLTFDDVLFNIFGGDNTTLSGGPTLQINNNGDILTGVFLDPNGMVSIVHSILNGRIFGGDSHDEQIVSGALINTPSVQVPDAGSSLLLLSMGMGFVAAAKKKLVG